MIQLSIQKTLQAANGEMHLNVSGEIIQGKFVAIYGASGAGKTTILRILAGLIPGEGEYIKMDEQVWADRENKIHLPPQTRKIGFVFQDYALFPNMTVKENLQFALEKGQSMQVVDELIEMVELQQLFNRKPQTLSGGQKQRVALARALVRKPELLLLDEPLSALDNEMRIKLQEVILKIHRNYSLTTIMVSHDISEIFRMADTIWVIENGIIQKAGTPGEIFFNRQMSGKFQFAGDVLQIVKEDIVYVISVLIGNNVVKVIADESEVKELNIGDKVMVASKAFNPLIKKYSL